MAHKCLLISRFIPPLCLLWMPWSLFSAEFPTFWFYLLESNDVLYHVPLLPVFLPVLSSRSLGSFWLTAGHSSVDFQGGFMGIHFLSSCMSVAASLQTLCLKVSLADVKFLVSVRFFCSELDRRPAISSCSLLHSCWYPHGSLFVPTCSCLMFLSLSYHLVLF